MRLLSMLGVSVSYYLLFICEKQCHHLVVAIEKLRKALADLATAFTTIVCCSFKRTAFCRIFEICWKTMQDIVKS